MDDFWKQFATTLLSMGGIGGLISYLAKSYFTKFLEKQSEIHKHELEIRFLRSKELHLKQLKIIEKLYQQLADLDDSMHDMTAILTWSHPKKDYQTMQKEKVEKASKIFNKARKYFSQNRIYFTKEACDKIEVFLKKNQEAFNQHALSKIFEDSDKSKQFEEMLSASKKVRKEIPELKEAIEDQFRELTGVLLTI